MVHTWTMGGCIVYTGIRLLLLIFPFISSFFFLSNFQTLKIFITLFSGTVILYTGVRLLLLLIHPIISSFFFLSNFQTLQIFVTFFSGTVRPRRLKLGAHMDNGWLYRVYRNQPATAYSSHLFLHFSFSPIFKH